MGVFAKPQYLSLYVLIFSLAFVILLFYTNLLSTTSCARYFNSIQQPPAGVDRNSTTEDDRLKSIVDDRFVFDPDECNVAKGKWVYNSSFEPLYTDLSCPYLDRQVSCVKNGKNNTDYRKWEWHLDGCILPRFDARLALNKIRGKRVMFIGDSLQRGQWQSFVCLVEFLIPKDQKSMRRGKVRSVFRIKDHNTTIEFYWAPFLIESNTDLKIIGDPKKRIVKVDSIEKHAKHWAGVDVLLFNTYVWWMTGYKLKSLWGSFANGEDGYEELEAPVSYRIALRTWANWIDSNIDQNKTRVFFTTMSPTHQRSADWDNKGGIKCYNETEPVKKKGHWGSGSDKRMMSVVSSVMGKMRTPVTLINITQLSEYRVDAHSSVWTELGGKLLTDEEKADPLKFADCIHWCLPGVPDTWNQIFLASL
ncbi:protein trichome birefringence-like 3 [Bidens hawaiensis]|uniref:protein trichome birefringence-like 3 n=1 Tax=Bidens hawaiensis TaxID=980011 RepID=UPI00404AD415